MAIIPGVVQGNDVLFEVNNGTEFVPFVCAKDVTIETTNEKIKVTTVGDGYWDKWRDQALSYRINFAGVIRIAPEGESFTAFDAMTAQMNFLEIEYRLIFQTQDSETLRMFKGFASIERSSLSGNTGSAALADFSLLGNGAYEIVSCAIEIGGIELSGNGTTSRTVTLTDVEGGTPAKYIWQVNNGFEQDAFTNPFTITFPNKLLTNTLIVFPVCQDDTRGQSKSIDFQIALVPTEEEQQFNGIASVNISNKTATSFDVGWIPSTFPGATGYRIIIRNTETGYSYPVEAAAPANITGLTPNTQYQITVIVLYGDNHSPATSTVTTTLASSSPIPPAPNKVIAVKNIGAFPLYLNGAIAPGQTVNRFIHTAQQFTIYSSPTVPDITFSLKFFNGNINLNLPGYSVIADNATLSMPDPSKFSRIEIDSDSHT